MIINDHFLLKIAMFIICDFWEKKREGSQQLSICKIFDLTLLSGRIGGNQNHALRTTNAEKC